MNTMKRVGLATGTLTDYETNLIESAIVKTIRPRLQGRTVMPIRQLPSAGFTQYTYYTENDMGQATISMTGEEQSMDQVDLTEGHVHIPIISKDYTLHWRDVLKRRDSGEDLNTQHAENAAIQVAEEEDKLIFSGEYTGWPAMGIEGLGTATGKQTEAGGDWVQAAAPYTDAFSDIANAKTALRNYGFYGPYKLIVPPAAYSTFEVPYGTTDNWILQMVGDLIGGVENIIVSPFYYDHAGTQVHATLIDTSPGNFELLVGADTTNYLAQLPTMNYQGKVWEAVVPVIKRPKAIVDITNLTLT